jgi:hypothetical protein
MGKEAIELYTETKSVAINLDDGGGAVVRE